MVCKLCLQKKKLIKAHIIPKSLYSPLRVDKRPPEILSNVPGTHPKRSPIGIYDRSILCADCEKRFATWDDYAQSIMLADLKEENYRVHDGDRIAYEIKGVDYCKFKLFFISLLWRASVSCHAFFSKVDVGPFEAQLKTMILNNDPGDENSFSVTLAKFDDYALGTAMLDPHREKWFGINYYRFYMAGFIAYIKADGREAPDFMRDFILRPNSSVIVILRDFSKSKEVALMQEIAKKSASRMRPD